MRTGRFSLIGCLAVLVCSVQAQVPDLNTPAAQQLKADCLAQQAGIATQRVDNLRKLIDEQVDSARQSLSRAKLSGNVTAQAAALSAMKIFGDVKTVFDKDGSYAVTGPVRRDLDTTVENFKRNAQVIEDKQISARKSLRRTCASQLGDLLAKQQTPVADEEKRLELVDQLLGSASSLPPSPASAASTNASLTAADTTNTASAVLASSGETANWTPLVRLEILVRDAIEVVSIPMEGLHQPTTLRGVGGIGNPWQVLATPLHELATGETTPVFRVLTLPPFKPAEVLAWPSPRNRWTLELRTKTETIPSRHGVVLETDVSACRSSAGASKTPTASTGNNPTTGTNRPADPARAAIAIPVKVRFESTPDGAYVIAGSQPLVAAENKPLLTPFETLLPIVPVDIRYRKRGYRDAVLPQTTPSLNAIYRVQLQALPGFADVTLSVPAAGSDWTLSGVRVKKGTVARFAATGEWSCGAGREPVDADGYPKNDAFNKYYQDPAQNPRLLWSANYGKLIARILPGGEIVAVGKQGTLTASAEGEVALAINESPTGRRDNQGKLNVRITVDPP